MAWNEANSILGGNGQLARFSSPHVQLTMPSNTPFSFPYFPNQKINGDNYA
jgi:hypothetical protein